MATGALSGVVAGLFPQSLIGAVAGGALASAAVQTYEMSLGWRCSYSGVESALSAGIGGAAHGAGVAAAQMAPKVAGFFRGGACFAAGTPIATREGSKPIEEIRAGDTVRTADPTTGVQSYGKVVRTFVGEVEKILEVETADAARVKATEGHPFFVEGRGFIAARKLARGDLLRRVDGRRVAVTGLGWEEARTRVYNFEVEGTHTYYAAGVWVHNAKPCDPRYPVDPTPYDRHPGSRPLTIDEQPGDYVYVRDVQGVIHVAPNGSHMHPQTLGGNQPATGAGTIDIRTGRVVSHISNFSGTFQFPAESLDSIVEQVISMGFEVPPHAIRSWQF